MGMAICCSPPSLLSRCGPVCDFLPLAPTFRVHPPSCTRPAFAATPLLFLPRSTLRCSSPPLFFPRCRRLRLRRPRSRRLSRERSSTTHVRTTRHFPRTTPCISSSRSRGTVLSLAVLVAVARCLCFVVPRGVGIVLHFPHLLPSFQRELRGGWRVAGEFSPELGEQPCCVYDLRTVHSCVTMRVEVRTRAVCAVGFHSAECGVATHVICAENVVSEQCTQRARTQRALVTERSMSNRKNRRSHLSDLISPCLCVTAV